MRKLVVQQWGTVDNIAAESPQIMPTLTIHIPDRFDDRDLGPLGPNR